MRGIVLDIISKHQSKNSSYDKTVIFLLAKEIVCFLGGVLCFGFGFLIVSRLFLLNSSFHISYNADERKLH